MNQLFINSEDLGDNRVILTKDSFHHFSNVLRLRTGDKLALVVDQNEKWIVEVTTISKEILQFNCIEKISNEKKRPKITLFQCIPKQDKFSEILNGCTQLGVDEIIPVYCERAVSKLKEGKSSTKLSRWRGVLESASNQSQRFTIPLLAEFSDIKSLPKSIDLESFDYLFLAWEEEKSTYLKTLLESISEKDLSTLSIGVLVGPEGGISQREASLLREYGFKSFTLGPTILRVEIAAISILSQLNYIVG
jgi:16S rRNA (uracil1498-N3)-methyltransferase